MISIIQCDIRSMSLSIKFDLKFSIVHTHVAKMKVQSLGVMKLSLSRAILVLCDLITLKLGRCHRVLSLTLSLA